MAKQRDVVKAPPLPVFLDTLQLMDPPQSHVTLAVPTADILLATVTLPKLNHQRLIQALPYALEEGLIDDVNRLHFALGPKMADGRWPVAVVAKTKMQDWTDRARDAGASLSCLIPDICTVPFAEDRWTIDITDTDCVARTGIFSGFSCSRENLATFLESALTECGTKPHGLHLRFFSLNTTLNLPALPDILVETTPLNPTDRARIAQSVIANTPLINLLQNEWRGDMFHGDASPIRLWKITGGLMIMSILILFSTQIAGLMALQHNVDHLKAAISDLYFRHFPNASSVIAPKTRFNEKLRALGGQDNAGRFDTLLAKAAKPLASQPNIRAEWMDYRNHQLQIGLTAPSFDRLDSLIKALRSAGLTVHQQTAATDNGAIKATLMIRSHP